MNRSRITRLGLVALAFGGLALLVGACSLRGTSGSENSTRDDSDSTLTWSDCSITQGAQCATLSVPLDWSQPDGDSISLALGRIPATGSRRGAVVVNPGGPGGSGLSFLGGSPLSSAVNKHYDIVSWDPRGVGDSNPLSCGRTAPAMLDLDPDPDTPSEMEDLQAAARAVSKECADNDMALLPHLSTNDVARDLEAIRVALGSGRLNYLGFSYGTQIGQIYAEHFPDQIRTMVLDGVVDPSLGYTEFLLDQTREFEAAFERNAAACKTAARARCGVDDLGDAYDTVQRAVESEPLDSGKQSVGPAQLATAAVMSSYWSDGWAELGPALAEALRGNGRPLRSLADAYNDLAGYTAYAAVVCTDSPPPSDEGAYENFADEARKLSPRLGGTIANELLPCATWPVEARSEPGPIQAKGSPPILVIGNTGDPATPYDNAVAVAKDLDHGVLVTVDMAGHTAYGTNACVTEIVDKYLLTDKVPDQDPKC